MKSSGDPGSLAGPVRAAVTRTNPTVAVFKVKTMAQIVSESLWQLRLARWLVVTPQMHEIHHSVERAETDSNFGFNLPWWDRLFGTYVNPQSLEKDFALGSVSADQHVPRMIVGL